MATREDDRCVFCLISSICSTASAVTMLFHPFCAFLFVAELTELDILISSVCDRPYADPGFPAKKFSSW